MSDVVLNPHPVAPAAPGRVLEGALWGIDAAVTWSGWWAMTRQGVTSELAGWPAVGRGRGRPAGRRAVPRRGAESSLGCPDALRLTGPVV